MRFCTKSFSMVLLFSVMISFLQEAHARCRSNRALVYSQDRSNPSHPSAYKRFIYQEAKRHRMDHNLLLALVDVESSFRSHAISPSNAIGLAQITIPVARDRLCDQESDDETIRQLLLTPTKNIRLMIAHLKWIKKHVKPTVKRRYDPVTLISAIYNAGQLHFVNKHHRLPKKHESSFSRRPKKYKEMVNYIRKVKGRYEAYKSEYGASPHVIW